MGTPRPVGCDRRQAPCTSAGRGAPRRLVGSGRRSARSAPAPSASPAPRASSPTRPGSPPLRDASAPDGAGPSAGPLQLDLHLRFVVAHLDLDLDLHLIGHVHHQALAAHSISTSCGRQARRRSRAAACSRETCSTRSSSGSPRWFLLVALPRVPLTARRRNAGRVVVLLIRLRSVSATCPPMRAWPRAPFARGARSSPGTPSCARARSCR